MPKIGSYDSDVIHPQDKLLGTEGDPQGDFGSTKNHSVEKVYVYTKTRLLDEGGLGDSTAFSSIEGGSASTIYLGFQGIDGGDANSVFTTQGINGGLA